MSNFMKNWHIVGICGIGMSALAQFARSQNIGVSGSDRALEKSENAQLKAMLQAQGIELYPQDGSRFAPGNPPVDAVVYSSAIEESNPDFASSQGIERLHRATALKELILQQCSSGKVSVAVAGTCGKTSTTAIISEALNNAGDDPECINGGMVKAFMTEKYPGNYRPGKGAIVFEADESDKSLLEFHPDYALVLNIGTDHYPKAELAEMFACFVNQCRKGAVLEKEVFELIGDKIKPDLVIKTFSGKTDDSNWCISDYKNQAGRSLARFNNGEWHALPSPGRHTALNAAAAAALLELSGYDPKLALRCALNTHGVARRFDYKGKTACGAKIYDDYAHNPEKLATVLSAAQEVSGTSGRVLMLFQPHGYGPFKFMAEELGRVFKKLLRSNDKVYLAEPFYAGGTSSFSPHAEDVLQQWQNTYTDINVELFADRQTLKTLLRQQAAENDVILIAGARDNTLAMFASELADGGKML